MSVIEGQSTADLPTPSTAMKADFSSSTTIQAKQKMERSSGMKADYFFSIMKAEWRRRPWMVAFIPC